MSLLQTVGSFGLVKWRCIVLVVLSGPFVLMEIVGQTACLDRKTVQQDVNHSGTRRGFLFVASDGHRQRRLNWTDKPLSIAKTDPL